MGRHSYIDQGGEAERQKGVNNLHAFHAACPLDCDSRNDSIASFKTWCMKTPRRFASALSSLASFTGTRIVVVLFSMRGM